MSLPLKVKEAPANDRPREQLLAKGAAALRTAELLAILIRSGRAGESAVQAAERVAAAFANRLELLTGASRGELKEISSAIGPTAYCQIMAGIELGRRIATRETSKEKPSKISNSEDAIAFCRRRFARLIADGVKEEFHVVCLDTKNHVIDTHLISVGTLDSSLAHPREIFRPAIKDAAASVILVHNHPTGDPTPSREDMRVTDHLEKAGKTLGIDVLDHIILGSKRCRSVREK